MSNIKQPAGATITQPSAQIRATIGTPAREPSAHSALRSLVSKLDIPPNNHSLPPFQAPLVEVEHEGVVYSLFCRKKQACPAFVELSPREKDIARMIAAGSPNKMIAASLEISEWTVSTHLRRIFAKLGVSCRAAMVSKWFESHNQCKEPTFGQGSTPAPVSSPLYARRNDSDDIGESGWGTSPPVRTKAPVRV